MKLYVFPIAPNPTKVRLYLAEKTAGGAMIDLPQVTVNLRKGEQRGPAHLARNPFGKLPVLELEDGSYLIESLAIIEYLEECYPDPPMIGRTALERARVRELERIAELGVLLPVGRIVHATNSPLGFTPNPGVAAHFRSVLPDALRVLDERLSDGRHSWQATAPVLPTVRSRPLFSLRDSAGSRSIRGFRTWPSGTPDIANARSQSQSSLCSEQQTWVSSLVYTA